MRIDLMSKPRNASACDRVLMFTVDSDNQNVQTRDACAAQNAIRNSLSDVDDPHR